MEEMIRAFTRAFHSSKIKYVIIGGIAASIWGRPRATLDADLVILIQSERVPELLKKLAESGFQVALTTEKKLLKMLPAKIRYEKSLSVDLRIASYSLDKQALERSVSIMLFGMKVPVASKEDIIAYKIARLNDIDKADIKAIIARYGKKLNHQYIITASEQLFKESGLERIELNLKEFLSWKQI